VQALHDHDDRAGVLVVEALQYILVEPGVNSRSNLSRIDFGFLGRPYGLPERPGRKRVFSGGLP
jgi:hypothetical protein